MKLKDGVKSAKKYSGTNIFSSKIVCGDCGGFYGSKVWHSNDKYRKTIWQCNNKFKGDKCSTPTVDENTIKEAFVKAYNIAFKDKNEVVNNCEMLLTMLNDTSKYDTKIEKLNTELSDISTTVSELIHQNATTEMSQEKFNAEYERLVAEYEKKEKILSKLQTDKEKQNCRISEIELFINNLKSSPDVLSEWDDMLWIVTISKATIHHNGTITFEFKDGNQITV